MSNYELCNAHVSLSRDFYPEHFDEIVDLLNEVFEGAQITYDRHYCLRSHCATFYIRMKRDTARAIGMDLNDITSVYPIIDDMLNRLFMEYAEDIKTSFENDNVNIDDISEYKDAFRLIYDVRMIDHTTIELVL